MCIYIGCAFVTYRSRESAEMAQIELHDKVILPTVSRWTYSYENGHIYN